MKTKTLTVRMTPQLMERIGAAASAAGRTRNEWITLALASALEAAGATRAQPDPTPDPPTPRAPGDPPASRTCPRCRRVSGKPLPDCSDCVRLADSDRVT